MPLASTRPYLIALAIFVTSRLAIALAIKHAGTYLTLQNGEQFPSGVSWFNYLLRWDSNWYAQIATQGYSYSADPNVFQTVVFYPLYPLLARYVSAASGLSIGHAMLLIANLAAVAAIVLLFKLVREGFGDATAYFTVAALSFFPGSLFLSAGYTESLALMFALGCFLALKREHYLLAAVCAGFGLGARSSGLALLPVLGWEMWRRLGDRPGRLAAVGVPCLIVAAAGLWLYMIYLWAVFGNPLAFSDGQAAFHSGTTFGHRLIGALTLEPLTRLRWSDTSPSGLDQWFFLLLTLLTLLGIRRLPASMTLFSAGILLLPYLTLSGGPAGFTSMSRFGLLAFPAFIVLGDAMRRHSWLGPVVIGLFAAILFMYASLFAQWHWVA